MESKMENCISKSNKNHSLPPRRGQIKIKILKSLKKSATELLKKNRTEGSFTPSTATPGGTPSGYDSGADSNGLQT